jgi:RNA:NAD 2'-phosphotransferase (TPT1/KptA family)
VRLVGLLPIRRRFVHLTSNLDYARSVGKVDGQEQTVLVIRAQEASKHGQRFFRTNGHVWLTDALPHRFLDLPEE